MKEDTLNKSEFRSFFKERINNLSSTYRATASKVIHEKVLSLASSLKNISDLNFFCYHSITKEVETVSLISYLLANHAKVWVPRCNENEKLEAVQIKTFKNLVSGKYNIPQPHPELNKEEDFSLFDMAIIPGFGFSKTCQRLGRGKAYYDFFLEDKGSNFMKVGVCFDVQIVNSLPVEKHDVFMDYVFSESLSISRNS